MRPTRHRTSFETLRASCTSEQTPNELAFTQLQGRLRYLSTIALALLAALQVACALQTASWIKDTAKPYLIAAELAVTGPHLQEDQRTAWRPLPLAGISSHLSRPMSFVSDRGDGTRQSWSLAQNTPPRDGWVQVDDNHDSLLLPVLLLATLLATLALSAFGLNWISQFRLHRSPCRNSDQALADNLTLYAGCSPVSGPQLTRQPPIADSEYDQLTGLLNRRSFFSRCDALLHKNSAHGLCALLFLDLDHFKSINDTFGHHVGDALLRSIASTLQSKLGAANLISRFGGDEFVALLANIGQSDIEAAKNAARSLTTALLAALSAPRIVEGHVLICTASVGLVLFPSGEENIEGLIQRADIAMYESKAAGRNAFHFFDPADRTTIETRAAIETVLRNDINARHFSLHYQPQVDRVGQIIGAEALVRWPHIGNTAPTPAEFIAIAEKSGLIISLGDGLLEQACHQLATWSCHPAMAPLTIAVNISGVQLRHHSFVERVSDIVLNSGANPNRLTIEITESIELSRLDEATAKMRELRKLGIKFSLDDFGTGYSSLSHLRKLPVDQLKIDKSFTQGLLVDADDAAIARSMIELGTALGLDVIAEGVESTQQHEFLMKCGCNGYQGYLFGRPMPPEQFKQFVTRFQKASTPFQPGAPNSNARQRTDTALAHLRRP